MRVTAVLTSDRETPRGADESGGASWPAGADDSGRAAWLADVDEVVRAPALSDAIEAAMRTDSGWLWLIDAATTPDTGALGAFRAVLEAGDLPAPLILTGKVVDASGAIHRDSLPNPEMFEKDAAVAAAEHGVLQIRAARPGSVLVARRAVERFGGPRAGLHAPYDVLEWTARILRSWDDVGYLVPQSLAVRSADGWDTPRGDRAKALLTGPGWTPTEKLWNAYTMVVR